MIRIIESEPYRHARINSNSRIDILLVLKLFLC